MSDRRQRIEDAFADALDLPELERDAMLRARFADDPEALTEVTSLLGYADPPSPTNGGGLRVVVEAALRSFAAPHVGARLGPYRLIELLGQGGMGTVYLAERDDERFERTVAIKILQHELSSPDVVARFRDERHILAALDHPGIVRLLDGGETDDGLPYLVMEHVDGVPLAKHALGLAIRERVELVIRIAGALQYAHQKLIVHRDVKPGNVLVDASGAPKLLDFGIAKLVATEADHQRRTRTGMAVFTPEYASPEQARGGAINVATDVYSLGAVLYELLTGVPPQRAGASPLETLRRICDDEPARASIVAPRAVRRHIAGDLDNIVARALQKKPEARYPSVAELADDLQRHLDGLPVRAREASLVYRSGKLLARHAGKLALASLVAAALVTATIVSVRQARRADRQRRDLILLQGWQELRSGHAGRALPYLVEALALGDDSPATRFMIAEAARPYEAVRLRVPYPSGIGGIAWAPDGKRFAACLSNGTIHIHDRGGAVVATLSTTTKVMRCEFDPTGGWLVAFDRDSVTAWETASFRRTVLWRREGHTLAMLAFSHTGRAIVGSWTGHVTAFELATGASRELPRHGELASIDVTPDGRRLAIAHHAAQVELVDLETGALLAPITAGRKVRGVRALRDGSFLLSLEGKRVEIVGTGTTVSISGHNDGPTVELSADEKRIVTTTIDGAVKVWNRSDGSLVRELAGLGSGAWRRARFSADGTRVVGQSGDAFVVWNVDDKGVVELEYEVGIVQAFAVGALDARFSPDGRELLLASATDVRIVATGQSTRVAELDRPDYYLTSVAFSPVDPNLVVTGGRDRGLSGAPLVSRVELLDLARGATLARISAIGDVWDVAFAPDGKHAAFAGAPGAHLVEVAGFRSRVLDASYAGHAEFNRDGRLLATAHHERAWIWRVQDGAPLYVLPHPGMTKGVSWSHDGRLLATACTDTMIRIWSTDTFLPIGEFTTTRVLPLNIAFSPDDREIAIAGRAGELEVWSVSGERRLSLSHRSSPIVKVVWSSDGGLLLAADDDGPVHVWDARGGRLLASRMLLPETLHVVWTPDGKRAVSANVTGKLTTWDMRRDERSVDELEKFAAEAVQYRVRADGSLELAGDR